MGNIIFLLCNSKSRELVIKSSIGSEYEIFSATKSNLMVEIYLKNPKILIVDIDSFGGQTLEMIRSILDAEYLPAIYIYSEKIKINDQLKNEILVPLERLQEALLPLIKQSVLFKSKYDDVLESYNAIDILNGEVKNSLKKYVNMETADLNAMIKELLNLVFAQNLFLTNKPDIVWVLFSKSEIYSSIKYIIKNNKYIESIFIDIDKNDSFKFDIYAVNGFSKNFHSDEISDISFSHKNFPKAIKNNSSEINNFSGFAIGSLILIGMNYKNIVTSYDIAIMKALAINIDLIETIKYQMNDLEEAFEYTTNALARAAEANDDLTGHHIKRVNEFAKIISEEMGMDNEFTQKIYNGAQMHDVGKIYVDKSILTKAGKLTYDEFEEVKKHTVYGEKIIGNSKYLKMSAEIARSHHEKYDGTGYPDGKKGEEIPLSARIVTIADIYDALRSVRSYKPSFTHKKAYEIITIGDGRVSPEHFDPKVLDAFKKVNLDFEKIYEELKD